MQLAGAGSVGVLASLMLTTMEPTRARILLALVALGANAWTLASLVLLARSGGRRWIVARRYDWLLGLSTCLVAVLVVDVFLSWTDRVPTLKAQRDRSLIYTYNHFAGYRLVPKLVQRDGLPAIRINSRGFRGPEIAPTKAPGMIRVAFLGGSQVFDYHGDNWPVLTGELLRGRGLEVEIINAAVPGNTSTDSLSKLATDLWTLDLDAVLVCHGWNDVKYFSRVSAAEPYRGLPDPTPMFMGRDWRLYPSGLDALLVRSSLYRLIRSRLLDMLISGEGVRMWTSEADDAPAQLGPTGPQQFEINLRLIAHLAEHIGALGLLCKQATARSGTTGAGVDVERYAARNLLLSPQQRRAALSAVADIVDRVAADTRMRVVDFDAVLSDRIEFFRDGVHFNSAGSAAAAETAAAALAGALAGAGQ